MSSLQNRTPLKLNSVCFDNIIFGLQKYGGISNYWLRLTNAMTKTEHFQARSVNPKVTISELALANSLPFKQHCREFLPARISRYLPFDAAECSVAHTSYYRIPRKPVRKYIVTAYDFMYERYRSGPARWVHSAQKRRSLEAADVIVCISSFTREQALHYIPSLDPAKLVVIPLGIDTSLFYRDDVCKYASPMVSQMVVFVGQRGGYKRFDLALKALKLLPDLTLSIVGAPMSQAEKEKAEELIPGRWLELGQIPNNELRQLFSSAYAFIYPSDCEGFGLPILEAMACSCPVVCSKLGSLPEVGSDASLYAEEQTGEAYAEKLKMLEVSSTRNVLSNIGAKNVARFTWERTIQDTIALYEN